MVAFAILVSLGDRLPSLAPWDVVRVYRAWGAGFGLSLGACILGGLSGYWLRTGSFAWGFGTSEEALISATFLVFFAMWISNLFLEVWTLEPLRKLDQNGVIKDEAAYRAGASKLSRHMLAQALLAASVAILATISGLA